MTYNRNVDQSVPSVRKTRISNGLRQNGRQQTSFPNSPADELSLYLPAADVQKQFGESRLA